MHRRALPEHSKMIQVPCFGVMQVMQSDVQIHHFDRYVLTEISVVESGSDLHRTKSYEHSSAATRQLCWQDTYMYNVTPWVCSRAYCLIDTQNMFPEGM